MMSRCMFVPAVYLPALLPARVSLFIHPLPFADISNISNRSLPTQPGNIVVEIPGGVAQQQKAVRRIAGHDDVDRCGRGR